MRKHRELWSREGLTVPDLKGLSVARLLELANERQSDAHYCRHLRKAITGLVHPDDVSQLLDSVSIERPVVSLVALGGIVQLAPDSAFDWLKRFYSSIPDGARVGALRSWTRRAIVALSPELTLPLARVHLFDKRLRARSLAEDIPALRYALAEALEDDSEYCYRICDLLRAFEHVGIQSNPIPELSEAFSCFRYSYGRKFALGAIFVTSPRLLSAIVCYESLWDCEAEVRAFAAQHVPTDEQASKRLQGLASSSSEDPKVREAASQRL